MVIRVSLVYSPAAREVHETHLTLQEGATVRQALQESGLLAAFPELDPGRCGVGVWGRMAVPEQVLLDQDRIEIYRGLQVDPKVARRERFRKQGSRSAGLFSHQRKGGKAGY